MSKCDGDSRIFEAVADSLEFKTMVVGDNSHAEAILQAGSYWWSYQDLRELPPAGQIVLDPTTY